MLPRKIVAKIPSTYETGISSGELFFFPSTVHKHRDPEISGVEFEIRLCPALQKKPTLPTPHFDGESVPSPAEVAIERAKGLILDPFMPPYNPNLLVGFLKSEEEQEDYVVLMNKYSVVPRHFLLVTKDFKSQTSPLMPEDLVSVYSLLVAADKARKPVFAFYNCGDVSGASQPHKHLQFLPLDEDEDGPPIELLARSIPLESADKPFSLTVLPYANHVYRLPPRLHTRPSEQVEHVLSLAFLALLDLCISTIRHDPDYPPGKPSYNVIFTLEHLYVIPRRQETHTLAETNDELSINALGFAGMLLVKSEAELEAVKKEGVGKILRSVGLKSVHDLQVAGTSAEAEDVEVTGSYL